MDRRTAITITILMMASCLFVKKAYSQVTIGMGEAAVPGALLDLKSQPADAENITSKKGLQLSRVSLTNLYRLEPMFEGEESVKDSHKTAHIGLIVYNMTTDESEDIYPGLYIWDGEKWFGLQRCCKDTTTPTPPDEIDPSEYTADNTGNIYIQGVNCLNADHNTAQDFDDLRLPANLVQTYELLTFPDSPEEKEKIEKVDWNITPNVAQASALIKNTSVSADGLRLTITYIDDAANKLVEALNSVGQPDFVLKIAVNAYICYKDESKISTQKVCYMQNGSCCEGYICKDCAFDYKNGTPGDWARLGKGSENGYSSNNTAYVGGVWGSYDHYLTEYFLEQSTGDLCVYKKDEQATEKWSGAVENCQDGDYTDGRGDWGWYLPNIKEMYMIYKSLGGNGSTLQWNEALGTQEDFGGSADAEPLQPTLHYSSTELGNADGSPSSGQQAIQLSVGDGSVGQAPKNSNIYSVRCVRRLD